MSKNSIAQECSLCGLKPRQPRRKSNYGLPGPNPPRNASGGFKVTGLGAYERLSGSAFGCAGGTVRLVKPDDVHPYNFKPATFIPQWVKYAVILAQVA